MARTGRQLAKIKATGVGVTPRTLRRLAAGRKRAARGWGRGGAVSPRGLLRSASPSAFKVYAAMLRLGPWPGETFAASAAAIEELTGLSHPTVVYARQELVALKVVERVAGSHYRVTLGAAHPRPRRVVSKKGSSGPTAAQTLAAARAFERGQRVTYLGGAAGAPWLEAGSALTVLGPVTSRGRGYVRLAREGDGRRTTLAPRLIRSA